MGNLPLAAPPERCESGGSSTCITNPFLPVARRPKETLPTRSCALPQQTPRLLGPGPRPGVRVPPGCPGLPSWRAPAGQRHRTPAHLGSSLVVEAGLLEDPARPEGAAASLLVSRRVGEAIRPHPGACCPQVRAREGSALGICPIRSSAVFPAPPQRAGSDCPVGPLQAQSLPCASPPGPQCRPGGDSKAACPRPPTPPRALLPSAPLPRTSFLPGLRAVCRLCPKRPPGGACPDRPPLVTQPLAPPASPQDGSEPLQGRSLQAGASPPPGPAPSPGLPCPRLWAPRMPRRVRLC